MFDDKFALYILYVIGIIGLVATSLGTHVGTLDMKDANVQGHWSGYLVKCAGCAWDKNLNTYAWEVGMNNGKGDTFVVKYSWPKDLMKGNYTKVKSITIFAKENSHCYPAVDRGYAYNLAKKEWVHGFTTSCGGTKIFKKTFNTDQFFNYSDNSVKVRLNAYDSSDQDLYELGVLSVEYWYNWFPRANFTMPGRIYINASINDTALVWDPDGDKTNVTETWKYNGKNLTNITEVKLKIGDKLVHTIHACDPYNCTEINHDIRVINFVPKIKINTREYSQGNKSLNISLTVNDIKAENQTHNVTCMLGNNSYTGSVEIGKNKIKLTTPKEEGNYTLECRVCDGINCSTDKKVVVVDNTPPKFIKLEIPKCTNLKSLDWETNEPSHLIFSNNTSNNFTEGKALLCVRPVDRAGNIGEKKCENVTIDFTPPEIEYKDKILLPNTTYTVNAADSCGVNGTIIYKNTTCSIGGPCPTQGMHRGNNTVLVNASDGAGNWIVRNITVRINLVPKIKVKIPILFADSKKICEYNVSNEPDQNYTVNKTILVNGKPYNNTLKRGDNVTCIIEAKDALNETGKAIARAIVVNKPPEVKVSYLPKFPSVGDEVHLKLAVSDIDGDNVTTHIKLENKTINLTVPKQKMPGNKTVYIYAWDGYNWTNTSLVIPYHLCGDSVKEPGEECDGSAKPGYRCVHCRLVRRTPASTGSSGGGWGGGYSAGSNTTNTPIKRNETKSTIKTKTIINVTNQTNQTNDIRVAYNISNMTSAMYAAKNEINTKQDSFKELERGITLGNMEKSPATAMITMDSNLLSILVSAVILFVGFKNRHNIRRLSIRLKAMTTKMRSRKSNALRRKDFL